MSWTHFPFEVVDGQEDGNDRDALCILLPLVPDTTEIIMMKIKELREGKNTAPVLAFGHKGGTGTGTRIDLCRRAAWDAEQSCH